MIMMIDYGLENASSLYCAELHTYFAYGSRLHMPRGYLS